MIEFIDNLVQVLVTLLCCFVSSFLFHQSRKQAYFLLACFFGCFTFSGVYWTLYYLLFFDTPHIFYVSEIGWFSGFILLNLLQYTLSDPEERVFRTRYCWIALLIGIPCLVFYCSFGDLLFNILMTGIMIIISWHAIKGLVFRYQKRDFGQNMVFSILMLIFVILEYCLWIASGFWIGDTLWNPYFWFDFLLTFWCILLLYWVKRMVNQ